MDKEVNGILSNYFDLSERQIQCFDQLHELYPFWNNQINVISRKDIDQIEEHHFLHSLAIAKIIQFQKGSRVLDIGTGGGFPGIPLAIYFPEVEFTLVDSIGKKIKVVENISRELGLTNVIPITSRAENLAPNPKYDFIVSRAVTRLNEFWPWVAHRFEKKNKNSLSNGLLALKGGDLQEEIQELGKPAKVYSINEFFKESFFETKKVVFVPNNGKE